MAVNLLNIVTALANQIDAGTSRALACYHLVPPTVPQFPCAIVRTRDPLINYHETFGSAPLADVELEVLVLAHGTSDYDSQVAVLELLSTDSANSVPNAIEADRTLGGVVGNCVARTGSGLSRSDGADGSAPVMASIAVSIYLR